MFKKIDLLYLVIVILVASVVWHGVLNQIIDGEGYYYFSPIHSFIVNGKATDILHNYDNAPRSITYLLENIFKGNVQGYIQAQFSIMILLYISIYLSIKKITGRSSLALIATLYMAANYTGSFQFYGRGHFQWFLQRIPEVFPILTSVAFLSIFLSTQKIRYYFFSLTFFTLAVFMTHYTTLFLPFFPALLLSYYLINKRNKENFIRTVIFSISFILVNYLIVSQSTLGLNTIKPNQTLLESLISAKDLLPKISFQLTAVTIPFSLTNFISDQFKENPQQIISKLAIPTFIIYISIFFYLYKRKFSHLYLVLASFLALLAVLFLNVYLARINVYNEIEQGRYYFIPGFYIAIIFASFLDQALVKPGKKLYLFILIVLLAYWIIPNYMFIQKKINQTQRYHTGGKLLFAKLDEIKSDLPTNSIVFLPQPLMPLGEDFLKKYYSGPDTKFLYIDSKWKTKIPEGFDLNKLYVFDFNEEFNRGGNARLQFISVVDESLNYRKAFNEDSIAR